MKKTLWLALALLLVCLFAFSACDNGDTPQNNNGNSQQIPSNNQNPSTTLTPSDDDQGTTPNTPAVCQHTFGEWKTLKQPTCKETGELIRVCSKCSVSEQSTIEKTTNHTEVIDQAVAATCTTEGKTEGKHCSVCGITIMAQMNVNRVPHAYDKGKCVHCNADDPDYEPSSEGLLFTSYNNGTCCVEAIGKCTDAAIIIPSKSPNDDVVIKIGSKAFKNNKNIISVTIPNTVKTIGYSAFENCTKLKYLNLSDGLNLIDSDAFSGCTSLNIVDIPDTVTKIASKAFYKCTGLGKVTLPNGLTTIEFSVFEGCRILNNISIPKTVTKIDTAAFKDCAYLSTLVLPDNLTEIGLSAFSGCTKLNIVTIPSGVTKIENFTFYQCESLTSIVLHENVSHLGNWAFYGCKNLAQITIENKDCVIVNDTSSLSVVKPTDIPITIPENAKIIGKQNSTAQQYASKYGIAFEILK